MLTQGPFSIVDATLQITHALGLLTVHLGRVWVLRYWQCTSSYLLTEQRAWTAAHPPPSAGPLQVSTRGLLTLGACFEQRAWATAPVQDMEALHGGASVLLTEYLCMQSPVP